MEKLKVEIKGEDEGVKVGGTGKPQEGWSAWYYAIAATAVGSVALLHTIMWWIGVVLMAVLIPVAIVRRVKTGKW